MCPYVTFIIQILDTKLFIFRRFPDFQIFWFPDFWCPKFGSSLYRALASDFIVKTDLVSEVENFKNKV